MNLQAFLHSEYAKRPHFVLFGNPVSHSLSPLMHNAAAACHHLDIKYYAVQLLESEFTLLPDYLDNDKVKGINITIPYKDVFLQYADETDRVSQKIAAVNALVKQADGWKGCNSDPYGFVAPLKRHMDEIRGHNAVIFGTGGAAKAVICALADFKIEEITLVSRRPEDIEPKFMPGVTRIIEYEQWPAFADEAKLIVNTTPLGMKPYLHHSPVKNTEAYLLTDTICYDLIYNPAATTFLRLAKQAGAHTINGLEMLIHQGDKLFQWWTGKSFPVSLIKKKLNEALNR